jgi:hypothetical protein
MREVKNKNISKKFGLRFNLMSALYMRGVIKMISSKEVYLRMRFGLISCPPDRWQQSPS